MCAGFTRLVELPVQALRTAGLRPAASLKPRMPPMSFVFEIVRTVYVGLIVGLAFLAPINLLTAGDISPPKPSSIAASNNPVAAMLKFRVAPGMKVDLFAAEPM